MVTAGDLAEILKRIHQAGMWLLAAAKMDDDYKKNLLPTDFSDWIEAIKCFGASAISKQDNSKIPNYPTVDLPPFLKHTLIKIIKSAQSEP